MAKKVKNTTDKVGSWISWADGLGIAGQGGTWSKRTLLKFLVDCRDTLTTADSAELLILLQNMGLGYKIKTNEKFKGMISGEPGSEEREKNYNALLDEIDGDNEEDYDDNEGGDMSSINYGDFEVPEVSLEGDGVEEENIFLPKEKVIEWMKLDHEYLRIKNLNVEDFKYLVQNHLDKMWNYIINGKITIEDIEEHCYPSIREIFVAEYREVINMKTPEGYCFDKPLSRMQKLVAYRLKTKKIYGNWSGVGTGKTLAGVFAGRYVGAKNTLVITFNSTIHGWKESINSYFDESSSQIFTKNDMKTAVFTEDKFNYLILNYEFFQNSQNQRTENYLVEFTKRNKIDYIILDEVHSVKQRDEDMGMSIEDQAELGILSKRRRLIMKVINEVREKNPNSYLMVMTATPIINNLVEAKKLLELLNGVIYDEIGTNTKSVNNALQYHKHIKVNGIRYIPQEKITFKSDTVIKREMLINDVIIECVETLIDIDCTKTTLPENLKGVDNDLTIEQLTLDYKLNAVKDYIEKGTILYTYFVDEIVERIAKFVTEEKKLRVGMYTGKQSTQERKDVKDKFVKGQIDVLIGSTPIGTGVDGLQGACNKMILISLPWTHSEYEQLRGRIFRQGSKFNSVDIIIPKVSLYYQVNNIENFWSWDKHKLNIIHFKRDLFGIVVDGIIPEGIVSDLTKIRKQSYKTLEEAIANIEGSLTAIERDEIEKEKLQYVEIESIRKKISEIGRINGIWNKRKSKNNFDSIQTDPSIWSKYHTILRELRKNSGREEIPFCVIADKINKLNKPNYIVADLGCGDNLLKKEIQNKVLSFDMGKNPEDDSVIICNLSELPIEDDSVHIAVFSLSLMGIDHQEFIKEAKRVLVGGGRLFVAEPYNRWDKEDGVDSGMDELKAEIEAEGFMVASVVRNGKYFYIDAVNAL